VQNTIAAPCDLLWTRTSPRTRASRSRPAVRAVVLFLRQPRSKVKNNV